MRLSVRMSGIYAEFRRRRVFRTLLGYGIVVFAALQVAEPVIHGLDLPDWSLTLVVVALAAGFPVAAALAWIFDITPRGLERTAPLPSQDGLPAMKLTGTRLILLLVGLAVAGGVPGLVVYAAFFRAGAPARTARAPGAPSIAVLPFTDLSATRDQGYLADGVAEEILNALARVQGLRVVARTSSFSFRGDAVDLRAVASRLRVNSVLEGSLRRDGNRIRVTATLVAAPDGATLWTGTFDREMAGALAVQDEIAGAVTEALAPKLVPHPVVAPAGAAPSSSEAYREFLLGRHLAARLTPEGTKQAIATLEHAIELDPRFAPAWAALASALWSVADRDADTKELVDSFTQRALEAAERAVDLGPDLADGHVVRGELRSSARWDWTGALSDLQLATQIAPGDAGARLGLARIDGVLGRPLEGLAEAERAIDLDPLSVAAWSELGHLRMQLGDRRAAREAFERAAAIDPADQIWIPRRLAQLDLMDGKPAAALATFERVPHVWVRDTGLAMARFSLGDRAGSDAALADLVATSADTAALQIAQVHAWRGEDAEALQWLERARRQRDTGLSSLLGDVHFTRLHGDARFQEVLRRMGLPAEPPAVEHAEAKPR